MSAFFLGCFAFGLIFTLASFALGAFGSSDNPGLDFDFGDSGQVTGGAASGGANHMSPFSISTLAAFFAWFGGAGYLLLRYSSLTAVVIATFATLAGLVGGGIVFVVLSRFVLPRLTEMRQEDYQLQGKVARVTSPILPGGTGEIVYTVGGTRHAEGARCVTGEGLERGAEVVVMRVEKGIAWVEPWAKFADTHQLPRGDPGTP